MSLKSQILVWGIRYHGSVLVHENVSYDSGLASFMSEAYDELRLTLS